MKLLINNVAGVSHAELELNGVTVLAGYNGTGKSTICKALYALTDSLADMPVKIRAEKEKSLGFFLRSWSYGIPGQSTVLTQCDAIVQQLMQMATDAAGYQNMLSNLLKDAGVISPDALSTAGKEIAKILTRSDAEYRRFIVERSVRAAFRQQINAVDNDSLATITFTDEQGEYSLTMKDNMLQSISEQPYYGREAVYISTVNVLDVISHDPDSVSYIDRLQELLRRPSREEEYTFEEYQSNRENVQMLSQILSQIIEGRIVRENGKMFFYHERLHTNINFTNVASGLKTFAIIQTLIENGLLSKGTLLLVDEPEVNLHPEWQLKFAEILVLLHQKLGIRMLLNTHSPYFLRAIEIYLAEYELADAGKFYYMDEQDGEHICIDVTDRTEVIYQALYKPLENL